MAEKKWVCRSGRRSALTMRSQIFWALLWTMHGGSLKTGQDKGQNTECANIAGQYFHIFFPKEICIIWCRQGTSIIWISLSLVETFTLADILQSLSCILPFVLCWFSCCEYKYKLWPIAWLKLLLLPKSFCASNILLFSTFFFFSVYFYTQLFRWFPSGWCDLYYISELGIDALDLTCDSSGLCACILCIRMFLSSFVLSEEACF